MVSADGKTLCLATIPKQHLPPRQGNWSMFRDCWGEETGFLLSSHGCPPCDIVDPWPQQKRTNFLRWTSISISSNNRPSPEDGCHPDTSCDGLLPGGATPAPLLRPARSFHTHSLLLFHFLLYGQLSRKEPVRSRSWSMAHWQSPVIVSESCLCILTHRCCFLRAMDMLWL